MNTNQEVKLSMYYAVEDVCKMYKDTWVTNAVFAATHTLWAEKIPLIETNRDAQTLQTTGITTDKSAKRATMIENALFLVVRLQSYANVTNNPELLESIKYSASDLKKARDNDVVGICNTILAKANANVAALETYGIGARTITTFQNEIGAYTEMLAKPKVAKSQTKTATENLTKLFKEADDLLTKRMDFDIELFKYSKPEFYSQYKTARIIISTGGRATSVMGNVTMAGSSEPVKGVTFSFTADNGGLMKASSAETVKPVMKKSAEKGNFRVILPEGTYSVVVSKIGFKEQTLSITVASGETTNLKVELEKA